MFNNFDISQLMTLENDNTIESILFMFSCRNFKGNNNPEHRQNNA